MRLLMVEDDAVFADQLSRHLAADGISVDVARSIDEGTRAIQAGTFDGVLLDLDLPDGDGVTVLRRLRASSHGVPVLVVSGNGDDTTIIRLLECGADDFVVKPASLAMVRARVRALLRRGGSSVGESVRVGELVVDLRRRQAWAAGRLLELSVLEFNLLAHLVTHAESVQSRDELLQRVWGQQHVTGSNVVDVTVGRIRKELGSDEGLPQIEPVRGVGYVLRARLTPSAAQP